MSGDEKGARAKTLREDRAGIELFLGLDRQPYLMVMQFLAIAAITSVFILLWDVLEDSFVRYVVDHFKVGRYQLVSFSLAAAGGLRVIWGIPLALEKLGKKNFATFAKAAIVCLVMVLLVYGIINSLLLGMGTFLLFSMILVYAGPLIIAVYGILTSKGWSAAVAGAMLIILYMFYPSGIDAIIQSFVMAVLFVIYLEMSHGSSYIHSLLMNIESDRSREDKLMTAQFLSSHFMNRIGVITLASVILGALLTIPLYLRSLPQSSLEAGTVYIGVVPLTVTVTGIILAKVYLRHRTNTQS